MNYFREVKILQAMLCKYQEIDDLFGLLEGDAGDCHAHFVLNWENVAKEAKKLLHDNPALSATLLPHSNELNNASATFEDHSCQEE